MDISERGLSLIKDFEQCVLRSYKCPAGVWTIGWGHTATAIEGMRITYDQAEALLRQDVENAEIVVNIQDLGLSQCQFDAIVSFVFNVGVGNFMRSTLFKKLKQDTDSKYIAEEIVRWTLADGNFLRGLLRRRLEEVKLYYDLW